MPIFAKDWYDPHPQPTSFYQGDVIRDVPVIFLPDKISKWLILRSDPRANKLTDDVLGGQICKWFEVRVEGSLADKWQFGEREEFVAAKARLMTVVILTQTCDLENRNYYQIAPVYPENKQKENIREQLRENELYYAFYLPAHAPHIPVNSYVDIAHTTFMPKAYFPKNTVEAMLAARLTDRARTALQEQVARYFGRPFGFNMRDKVEQTSEYACVTCFYTRGNAVKREFQVGTNFRQCDACGDGRWIRIPPDEQPEDPHIQEGHPGAD
jgi:hypothetical protein